MDNAVLCTDVVEYAIQNKVRGLGGTDQDVADIAFAAAYAVWCHGSALALKG